MSGTEGCPFEVGAYYEFTHELVKLRLLGQEGAVPDCIKADSVVYCACTRTRVDRRALCVGPSSDVNLFEQVARFTYLVPGLSGEGILATFDVPSDGTALALVKCFKKVTSPLRLLAAAEAGLVP